MADKIWVLAKALPLTSVTFEKPFKLFRAQFHYLKTYESSQIIFKMIQLNDLPMLELPERWEFERLFPANIPRSTIPMINNLKYD